MARPASSYTKALEIWFAFYQERKREKYMMDAKSGMHLKQLLKKIEFRLKDKGIEASEERVLNAFAVFLMVIKDKWILDNLELAIVNSKYNVIISKASEHSPFVVASRIADIIKGRDYSERTAKTG